MSKHITKNSNIIFICVSTPTNRITNKADLKHVFSVTHNIKNIGDSDLITSFWISEHYNANDSDTYYKNV